MWRNQSENATLKVQQCNDQRMAEKERVESVAAAVTRMPRSQLVQYCAATHAIIFYIFFSSIFIADQSIST